MTPITLIILLFCVIFLGFGIRRVLLISADFLLKQHKSLISRRQYKTIRYKKKYRRIIYE